MSTPKKAVIAVATFALLAVGAGLLLSMWRAPFMAAAQPCCNNLRQLEGAKAQWVIENHKDGDTNAVPSWQDVEPYLYHNRRKSCPDGGTYILGRVGEQPKCSPLVE